MFLLISNCHLAYDKVNLSHISFCSAGNLLYFFLFSIYVMWQWAILHIIYLSNKSRETQLFLRMNNLLGANDPQPWKGSLTPKKCPVLKLLLIWAESMCICLWQKRGKAECLEFTFLHVKISLANQVDDAARIRKISFATVHHISEISVSGTTWWVVFDYMVFESL